MTARYDTCPGCGTHTRFSVKGVPYQHRRQYIDDRGLSEARQRAV